MQTHPSAIALRQFAQLLRQFQRAGFDRAAIKKAGAVLHIHAIGRSVLAHHQQLFQAAFKQGAGFFQHIAYGAADQIAAHRRDDAESAAVVAAFADF